MASFHLASLGPFFPCDAVLDFFGSDLEAPTLSAQSSEPILSLSLVSFSSCCGADNLLSLSFVSSDLTPAFVQGTSFCWCMSKLFGGCSCCSLPDFPDKTQFRTEWVSSLTWCFLNFCPPFPAELLWTLGIPSCHVGIACSKCVKLFPGCGQIWENGGISSCCGTQPYPV